MKTGIGSIMLAVLLATGCQSTGEEKPPAEVCPGFGAVGTSGASGGERVRFLEQPDVSVVQMRCVVRSDLLRIDVDVRNDRPREQRISYRFEWFDADAMSLDSEEAWKPLLLYPEEVRTIRTISPSASTRDFVLVIKR